jgi:hypothetical protein
MDDAERKRQESIKKGTLNSDPMRATRSANSSPMAFLMGSSKAG